MVWVDCRYITKGESIKQVNSVIPFNHVHLNTWLLPYFFFLKSNLMTRFSSYDTGLLIQGSAIRNHWRQGQLSLSSIQNPSNKNQGFLGTEWLKVNLLIVVALKIWGSWILSTEKGPLKEGMKLFCFCFCFYVFWF